jgi:hypothetical protein
MPWEDQDVHIVNDAAGSRFHLVIPGRSTAVCGEGLEHGADLGALTMPAPERAASPCMACIEIWSTWRGTGAWEGAGDPPDGGRQLPEPERSLV